MADVCCLVKGPDALNSKALEINSPDRFAKGQHSIKQFERKSQQLARIGIGPVVRVVQQSAKPSSRFSDKMLFTTSGSFHS